MTVNINNGAISAIRLVEQASNPATPSTGSIRLFVDNSTVYNNTLGSNTPLLKMIADDGTVTTFIGNVTTSGVGITFPPQQVASTNANTLDDYEEGTWSPTYIASGTALGSPIIYNSSRFGRYTKIGRMVHITGVIVTDDVPAGGSGSLSIDGLPFVSANITSSVQSIAIGNSAGFAGEEPSSAAVSNNAQTIRLYYRSTSDGPSVSMAPSDLTTGVSSAQNYIAFAGTYIV